MSWFKKPNGDELMMNNASGRPGAAEPSVKRPEPREPGTTMTRAAEVRAAEIRAAEARAAEGRAAEARAEPPRAVEVRVNEPAPRGSVLGPTLRFKGELSAQEDLIVQGSVEGSITHTQSLTMGTDGSMKGDIRARVIVIDGKVEGDLYATESVNIRATAKVKGNVFAPRVAISDGAFFQGRIDMQPSGAAVQEHSARQRQAALAAPSPAAPLDGAQVDQMLAKG
jgi:cytoskeletal protein CcmA (bactofilin family)